MAEDADIAAHHFDSGLALPEALAGEESNEYLIGDREYRRNHAPDGHTVCVATTPINSSRNGLASHYG